MARKRVHPQHTYASPKRRWDRFGEAAELLGMDRTELLNIVTGWYGHEEGVTLPRRPPKEAFTQQHSPDAD